MIENIIGKLVKTSFGIALILEQNGIYCEYFYDYLICTVDDGCIYYFGIWQDEIIEILG